MKRSGELNYSRFPGQPAPSSQVLDNLDQQSKWNGLQGSRNPDNLRLRFVKIGEQPSQGGRVADRYRVYVEGAPENKIFEFSYYSLNGDLALRVSDLYVNSQGLLMIHKPRPEQEAIVETPNDDFVFMPVTATAEPVRFIFSSMDTQIRILDTLVPHPMTVEDQGCKLEVRIALPDTKAVLVLADGFPAKSKIPLMLESEGQTIVQQMDADLNGHAVIADFPYVLGKAQGNLRATAEGPHCVPSIVLPWGPATDEAPKTP
ncbi:MAG: hypothetical protein ABSD72_05580 [Terracidiphilus sp.]